MTDSQEARQDDSAQLSPAGYQMLLAIYAETLKTALGPLAPLMPKGLQ